METKERILLDENTKGSTQQIQTIVQEAKEYEGMLKAYNQVEALENITDESELVDFLYNSKDYFEAQIIDQLGTEVNGVKPIAKILAPLYGIDYESTIRKFNYTCYTFDNLVFNPEDEQIGITRERMEEIKENSKIYAADNEVDMILYMRDFSKKLANIFEFLGVQNAERANLVNQVGLQWDGNNNFDVNIAKLRQKLSKRPFIINED